MTDQSFQNQITRKFPPNYRKEIIPRIMELIIEGESCFIVGISGSGKSNLFRCIRNQEVKEKYLGECHADFAFVWADTNALAGDLSAFYIYELILYSLQKWVKESGRQNVSLPFFQELHEKVVLSENRVLAQRYLETALGYLFNHIENFHLVLLFDEFEPIAKALDFQFFRNLRWLRDEFKYHLSYIIAAQKTPIAIREEFFDQGEALYELLAANILGLTPYNPDDTKFMVSDLSKRYGVEFEAGQSEIILRLSGGHSGLIAAIFKILLRHSLPRTEASQVEQLLSYDAVAGECRKIWNSLEPQEQNVLNQIASNNFPSATPLPLNSLIAKGVILKDHSNQIAMFSALFQIFLKTLL